MHWYQDEEEEEDDLMFSPALLARRASESWIDSAPVEVDSQVFKSNLQSFPALRLAHQSQSRFLLAFLVLEHPDQCHTAAQEIVAGRAANPGEQHDESRGGVGARISAARGSETSERRVGTIQS